MLQKREKVLLLRTFQGRTLRIVREHYLRPSVPCNSPLCSQPAACRNGQDREGRGGKSEGGRGQRGKPGPDVARAAGRERWERRPKEQGNPAAWRRDGGGDPRREESRRPRSKGRARPPRTIGRCCEPGSLGLAEPGEPGDAPERPRCVRSSLLVVGSWQHPPAALGALLSGPAYCYGRVKREAREPASTGCFGFSRGPKGCKHLLLSFFLPQK